MKISVCEFVINISVLGKKKKIILKERHVSVDLFSKKKKINK